jgi:glucose-1-phosphate thymidylyltransferase
VNIIVFEDELVAQLHPISLGRPCYAVTCGGYRLLDWLVDLQPSAILGVVRPHLAELQRVDYPAVSRSLANGRPVLLVNARLVPSTDMADQLRRLMQSERSCAAWSGEALAAVWLTSAADASLPREVEEVANFVEQARALPTHQDDMFALFEYPHDVIRWNMRILSANLEHRLSRGDYREIRAGVFAAEGARLGEHVVVDAAEGPIVMEAGASVGHFCLLRGPALLGRNARVIEYAAIKDAVSIGHTTKIGGEVEATVIEPFTNKQHHGFLGHSYIGSWVNLGAGTCNSDLKNTYGTVNMEYRGRKVASGMQFLGCIVGDYSKSAINTGIFTGKTIGVCSMLYGFITTNVPSYVNYARLFGQVTELPPEVMIAAQQRMFARRHVAQRPCDIQLIHEMYELTRPERQLADDPLTL